MPEKITLFSQKSPEKWFGGDISDFKSESIAHFRQNKPFLSVAGLAKPIGTVASEFTRVHEGQKIPFFTQQICFAGVYARAAQPLDGEVAETCFVDLQKLKSEIQKNPQNFTENFKVYFQHFETQLDDLVAFLKKIS